MAFFARFYKAPVRQRHWTFLKTLGRWLLYGSLIGLATGTASALLLNTNDLLTNLRQANPGLILLLPAGGVVIGYMYQYYGKGSSKGNDLVFEHIHHGQGEVPKRMGPMVFLSTFITHLVGGSTGREGAAIQMGGSIATGIQQLLRVEEIDRRILFLASISGGFGSAFGAPLTGTIFGLEITAPGKIQFKAFVPCFVASYVGHIVTSAWGVTHEHHVIETVPAYGTATVLKVIALAIIFGFLSVLYSQLRHGVERYGKGYLTTPILRGLVGGIAILALTYLVGSRDYLGRGLPMVEQAFTGQVPPLAFLLKLVFTAVTMGSGFRGGEVIPLFFMGSTLGNTLAPLFDLPVSFMAALGMIAVFCGAANAPLACFFLALEFFGGDAMIYFFIACLVSYIFSGHHGIYSSQKIYEPKSRMLNLKDGESLAMVEEEGRKE